MALKPNPMGNQKKLAQMAARMPAPTAKPGMTGLGAAMGGAGPSAPPQTQLAAMNNMLKGKGATPPPPRPNMAGLGAAMGGGSAPRTQTGSMAGLRNALGGAGVAARPFKKGGSASSRADGIATQGKTRGKLC